MAHRLIDVVLLRLASGDEIAVLELHRLGALRTKLAADDDLAALGAVLHNETHDSVASPAHGQAAEEFVAQGFRLRHGAARTVLHTLCEELHTVLGEAIALLHHSG